MKPHENETRRRSRSSLAGLVILRGSFKEPWAGSSATAPSLKEPLFSWFSADAGIPMQNKTEQAPLFSSALIMQTFFQKFKKKKPCSMSIMKKPAPISATLLRRATKEEHVTRSDKQMTLPMQGRAIEKDGS